MRHIRAVGLYQIGLLLALTLHTCEGFTAPPSLSLSTRRHEFSGGSVHGYGFQKCTVVAPTRRVRSYHLHMGLFDDIASKVKDALQEVTVQHILVDTESQAVSIRKEMAKVAGKAPVSPVLFGEYAARYSTCGSANKKPDAKMVQLRGLPGEMNFRRGQTDKAFEKACFEGSPGALQGPIKTQFGYHLVRVGGAKESGAAQGAGSEQAVDSGTVEGKQEQSKNALKKQARAKGKRGK